MGLYICRTRGFRSIQKVKRYIKNKNKRKKKSKEPYNPNKKNIPAIPIPAPAYLSNLVVKFVLAA